MNMLMHTQCEIYVCMQRNKQQGDSSDTLPTERPLATLFVNKNFIDSLFSR